jgi:hypothetical protein
MNNAIACPLVPAASVSRLLGCILAAQQFGGDIDDDGISHDRR